MKKIIATLLVLVMVFSLAACGGKSDAFKGTWSGEHDGMSDKWTFNGSGKCTYTNDFFSSDGKYTIKDTKVNIDLEGWDNPQDFTFTITDNNMKLKAEDPLGVDYDLTKE